jgi:excisionase family DNA binding protein
MAADHTPRRTTTADSRITPLQVPLREPAGDSRGKSRSRSVIRSVADDTESHVGRDTRALTLALSSMRTDRPLTLTVEQAGKVLGVGRSTYELVRSGDLASIRLRRRIVVPISHVAERLGVTPADVWVVLSAEQPSRSPGPLDAEPSEHSWRRPNPYSSEPLTLFWSTSPATVSGASTIVRMPSRMGRKQVTLAKSLEQTLLDAAEMRGQPRAGRASRGGRVILEGARR